MGIFLLIAAAVLGDPQQFQVTTVDGQTIAGALSELTGEQITLATAGADPKTLKLNEIRKLVVASNGGKITGAPSPAQQQAEKEFARSATIWIETIDGNRIPGVGFTAEKGIGQLKLLSGQSLPVPTKAIKLVEFRNPSDPPAAWSAPDKSESASDLIVVRKRDGVDFVEGAIGVITDTAVTLTVDGEPVPVKRGKIAGIVYFHPDDAAPLPAANCQLEDLAGWKLGATSVKLDGANLLVTTTFDSKLTWPLDSLKGIDFSASRITYLSDLTEESSDTVPYLDFGKAALSLRQYYKPHRDGSLDGGPLMLGRNSFPKGLTIPSGSTMVFKITGKGKRLKALAGIDDSVRTAGNVMLKISGDGKLLYEGRLTGHDAPTPLDMDVGGVKRLTISVEPGAGLDVGNYLDLCDARIVK